MDDLNRFLNWYLGARTRMSRAVFNVVFLFFTLPIFFITMSEFAGKGSELVAKGSLVTQDAQGILSAVHRSLYDVDKGSALSEEFFKNTQELKRDASASYAHLQDSFQDKDDSIAQTLLKDFKNCLNVLLYVFLIPIIRMRIRDAGVWFGFSHWVIFIASYSAFFFDMLKHLSLLTLPTPFIIISQVLSFVAFFWICTKKTAVRPHVRENYMPGDSSDDPY